MDLIEKDNSNPNRHPWELSRAEGVIPREYPQRAKNLPNRGAITFLKKLYERTPFRVHPVGGGHLLEPNRNCIYQLPILDHSGILLQKRYGDFLKFAGMRRNTFEFLRRYLDLFGVKYIYAVNGPVHEDGLKKVYNVGAEYVYENKRALTRAFIVHRAEYMHGNMILEKMADPKFDLRRNIILEEDLPTEILNCKGAPLTDNSYAEITSYTPHRILIKAELENDGFLVLSDTYYPGWKVSVDGKRSEIYLTDYLVRSVYLEKGEHIVEFIYRPFSFIAGGLISLLTVVCLVLTWKRT